jgi:phosphoenolpyruvate synthase/pyruvate phosphate dikinase
MIDIRHITSKQIEEFGAKTCRLGELAQLGFRVAPGFAIPVSYFQSYLETLQGYHKLEMVCSKVDSVRTQLQTFCTNIMEIAPPSHWQRDLETQLCTMNADVLVMRSSAVGEDSHTFSFAGILESKFCPNQPKYWIPILLEVLISRFSMRTFLYCCRVKIPFEKLNMAILIQEAISTEVGGVMFSQNPLNPNKPERLIEAVWGLPTGAVSGEITADRFFQEVHTGTITKSSISDKYAKQVLNEQGIVLCEIAGAPVQESCLSVTQLAQLHEAASRLESYYQTHLDIEWGFLDNQLYLFQVRPQTT